MKKPIFGYLLGLSKLVVISLITAYITACSSSLQPQETDLNRHLPPAATQIISQQHDVILILPSNTSFGYHNAILQPAAYSVLDAVVTMLKDYPYTQVLLSGYTDNIGHKRGNIIISEKRAKAIAHYLINHDISPIRIKTQGLGSSGAVADNTTALGRSKNRRVEMKFYLKPDKSLF